MLSKNQLMLPDFFSCYFHTKFHSTFDRCGGGKQWRTITDPQIDRNLLSELWENKNIIALKNNSGMFAASHSAVSTEAALRKEGHIIFSLLTSKI
jgi:hypothetical protein